jgi:hypothetical protein
MKRKVLIAIVGCLFVVFGAAASGLCDETQDVELTKIYGTFVDDYIQKCEAKAEMLDSGSLNIRKSAMRATVKGAYMQAHRTALVSYLVKERAPLNADRIAYHLNLKYAESAFPREVYVALLEGHVDLSGDDAKRP